MKLTDTIENENKEYIKWNHYEYYESIGEKDYIKIDNPDQLGGYNITLRLSSSSRGVNCYENEIGLIINKLLRISDKIKEIKKGGE